MTDKELAQRLEELERDNRRLKRGGFALLVMLVALATIYATRPVPDVIKAHEFEAVDGAGKVRVEMGISPPRPLGTSLAPKTLAPGLVLYDSRGRSVVELRTMGEQNGTLSYLTLWDPDNKRVAQIEDLLGVPVCYLGGPAPANPAISMGILKSVPNIELHDAEGYVMELGGTETTTPRTGQSQKTSADSIIMFGKDKQHHVIWQAP